MVTATQWIIIKKAYLKGNQKPFRVAFIQMKKKVLPYLRMKLSTSTEETIQDAYTDAVLSFAQYHILGHRTLPRNVEAYIRTAAYRNIIDAWRKNNNKKNIQVEELDHTKLKETIKMMFSVTMSQEESYHEQEKTEQQRLVMLQKAIQQLCDKCRTLIEEHLFEHKKLRQLQKDLNYRTYQSIVDKKQSCMKKLRKLFFKELVKFESSK